MPFVVLPTQVLWPVQLIGSWHIPVPALCYVTPFDSGPAPVRKTLTLPASRHFHLRDWRLTWSALADRRWPSR